MCVCAPSAAEPRGRPPPWKNPRLQPLHSAVHHPGTRISHHQPGHRRRQVADFLSSFFPIGVQSLCSVSQSISQSADELAHVHLHYFLLLFGLVSKRHKVKLAKVQCQHKPQQSGYLLTVVAGHSWANIIDLLISFTGH